jgi:hypothetical protein
MTGRRCPMFRLLLWPSEFAVTVIVWAFVAVVAVAEVLR